MSQNISTQLNGLMSKDFFYYGFCKNHHYLLYNRSNQKIHLRLKHHYMKFLNICNYNILHQLSLLLSVNFIELVVYQVCHIKHTADRNKVHRHPLKVV